MLSQIIKITILCFACFVISNCATIRANYHADTIQSWRNSHISSLLKVWGQPTRKMTTLSGSTVYVYKEQYNSNNTVKKPKRQPRRWENSTMLFCIVAFEVNHNGTITTIQSQGNHCFADGQFKAAMSNPNKDVQ